MESSEFTNINSIDEDPQTDDEERTVKSKTFYYSNFDLFDESSNFFFLKYRIFKNSLLEYLGEDWKSYASITIYFEKQFTKIYIDKTTIFNTALEVWLELRKSINADIISNANQNITNMIGKNFEEVNIFENFLSKFIEKFNNYKINGSTFKPVMQAFFVSAIKVWNDLISGKDIWKLKIEEKEEDEKKENSQPKDKDSSQASSQQNLNDKPSIFESKSKIIKPLLVAKEKIFDYFKASKKTNIGSKEKNLNRNFINFEEAEKEIIDIKTEQDKDLKNFNNFNSTMKIEAGDEIKNSIKDLSEKEMKNLLNPDISNFDIKNLNQKRKNNDQNIFIEVTKFTKKEEKELNKSMINHVSEYADKVAQRKDNRWQVARGLVTTMIEINYNYLISNFAPNIILTTAKDLRIRFLQPAQGFYNQLMDTWLIYKSNSLNNDVRFRDFLEKVKKSFGASWNESLFGPTQFFFNTLYREWNQIKEEDIMEDNHEDKVRLFVRRVRENMLNIWEENIIKKAEELDNKVIQHNSN